MSVRLLGEGTDRRRNSRLSLSKKRKVEVSKPAETVEGSRCVTGTSDPSQLESDTPTVLALVGGRVDNSPAPQKPAPQKPKRTALPSNKKPFLIIESSDDDEDGGGVDFASVKPSPRSPNAKQRAQTLTTPTSSNGQTNNKSPPLSRKKIVPAKRSQGKEKAPLIVSPNSTLLSFWQRASVLSPVACTPSPAPSTSGSAYASPNSPRRSSVVAGGGGSHLVAGSEGAPARSNTWPGSHHAASGRADVPPQAVGISEDDVEAISLHSLCASSCGCSRLEGLEELHVTAPSKRNASDAGDDAGEENTTKARPNFHVNDFVHIVSSAVAHNTQCLESWEKLSRDGQSLFVRLFHRTTGPWFKVTDLEDRYSKNMSVNDAVAELCSNDGGVAFAISDQAGSSEGSRYATDDVISQLRASNAAELSQVLRHLTLGPKRDGSLAKDALLQTIVRFMASQTSITNQSAVSAVRKAMRKVCKPMVMLNAQAVALFHKCFFLFFGDTDKEYMSFRSLTREWSSKFVLGKIGRFKFAKYRCLRSQPLFTTPREVEDYGAAVEFCEKMNEAVEGADFGLAKPMACAAAKMLESELTIPPRFQGCRKYLANYSCGWVYARSLHLAVPLFEQNREYAQAVDYLKLLLRSEHCPDYRGRWFNRLRINLEHMGRKDEALNWAERALLEPGVRCGDRRALEKGILHLAKPPRRWKKPVFPGLQMKQAHEVYMHGKPLNCTTGEKSRFPGFDCSIGSVEDLALQHYSQPEEGGYDGVHCEGSPLRSLFALFLWDDIYRDMPDAFLTPFQAAPLDLLSDHFYLSRKDTIDARLHLLRNANAAELVSVLQDSWDGHNGEGVLVNWDVDFDWLCHIACLLGGAGLASIFEVKLREHKHMTGGLPDLLLWKDDDVKFVEVKGPRDRLMERQSVWIDALLSSGVKVEVCHVEEKIRRKYSVKRSATT